MSNSLRKLQSQNSLMETKNPKDLSPPSDGGNIIDASMEMGKKKRKRKRRPKKQESIKPGTSLSSMVIKPTPSPPSSIKIAPVLTPMKRRVSIASIEQGPPEKYSKSLFDSSVYSGSESRSFNRTRQLELNDTFLPKYAESLKDSQIMSQLDRDLEELNEQLTPRNYSENSQRQHLILPVEEMKFDSQSDVTLNQAFESPVHGSRFDLLSQCDYRSSVTEQLSDVDEFVESVDGSFRTQHLDQMLMNEPNFEISMQTSESEGLSEVNEFEQIVNERLRTQYMKQSLINEQNERISTQLQNFECFIREKIDAAENYMRTKLTHIEDSNLAVVKALKDLKRDELVERVKPAQDRKIISKRNTKRKLVMPNIPVSKEFSLALLNSALKSTEYMDQFVSEISQHVTLNAYSPQMIIQSIMNELFSINLVIKYEWSSSTTSKSKPAFSSLTYVLRAKSKLLTDRMSEHEMRRELKKFFKKLPQIYGNQKQELR